MRLGKNGGTQSTCVEKTIDGGRSFAPDEAMTLKRLHQPAAR